MKEVDSSAAESHARGLRQFSAFKVPVEGVVVAGGHFATITQESIGRPYMRALCVKKIVIMNG